MKNDLFISFHINAPPQGEHTDKVEKTFYETLVEYNERMERKYQRYKQEYNRFFYTIIVFLILLSVLLLISFIYEIVEYIRFLKVV